MKFLLGIVAILLATNTYLYIENQELVKKVARDNESEDEDFNSNPTPKKSQAAVANMDQTETLANNTSKLGQVHEEDTVMDTSEQEKTLDTLSEEERAAMLAQLENFRPPELNDEEANERSVASEPGP